MTKKTEIITFRTSSEIKNKITEMANEKEWSIAQAVDKICKEYFLMKEKNTNNFPTTGHEKTTYEKTVHEKTTHEKNNM